jgi:hypothetical protein
MHRVISASRAIRVEWTLLASTPVLHGVRVMRGCRALIKRLALFNCQRVTGCNALNAAKNFHYSALNPISGRAWVFVIEQQTYRSTTHFYAERRMSTTCGLYLNGQKPHEQRGFSSPVR